MDRISRELAQFRHESGENFTRTHQEFGEIHKWLHAVEQSMLVLQDSFGGLQGTFNNMLDKLEVEFRFLYDEQEQANRRFSTIESRVDALEKRNPPPPAA